MCAWYLNKAPYFGEAVDLSKGEWMSESKSMYCFVFWMCAWYLNKAPYFDEAGRMFANFFETPRQLPP